MPFGRILHVGGSRRVLGAAPAAILLVSCFVASAPSTSSAQTDGTPGAATPAEPTTAREWFLRGEDQYHIGQYQLAVDAWLRAYSLDPRPRIQYNLAQAYERLGRLEEAIAGLEIFLAGADSSEPVYADATMRLAALRQRVASTGVILRGGPNGGEIFVDGQAWGLTPRPDRIPLSPGAHRVEVRYPNERTFRASITAPAGQVTEIEITEDAITGHTTQVVQVEVEAPPTHTMLYVGAGMAAVGLGALVYGIERQVKVSECNDPNNYCENLATGERQRSIGLGVGASLTAAGAALVVVDLLRHSAYERRQSALTCAPLMAGATCRLRF